MQANSQYAACNDEEFCVVVQMFVNSQTMARVKRISDLRAITGRITAVRPGSYAELDTEGSHKQAYGLILSKSVILYRKRLRFVI